MEQQHPERAPSTGERDAAEDHRRDDVELQCAGGAGVERPGGLRRHPLFLQSRHARRNPQARIRPGRYVGATAQEEDSEPFEEKMARLTTTLGQQFTESTRLEAEIRKNLAGLGYEI